MTRFMESIRTITVLMAGVAVVSSAVAASPAHDLDATVADAAQAFMQQNDIPGVAIAVTVQGKQRFYNYGVASRETGQKVTSDTLFELGSVSKTFTATLTSYAQADGRLSLSDHPSKYVPQLAGSDFDKVTLLELGTHTAGGFPLQVPDDVHDTAQLMDYFKHWKPRYAPGTLRTYANPSIGMLGMIAAKSLQMPFDVAMQKLVFSKLGLSNTYLHVPTDKMSLYAQGYNSDNKPVRLNPGVLADEAYGVKSSAKDMLHVVEANLGLVEVEPKLRQALDQTRVGYFKVGPMTQDLIWEQMDYPVQLHTLLESNAAKMILQDNAVTRLKPPLAAQQDVLVNKTGATNGFGSYVVFVPAKKIGIVILANRNHPTEARLRLAYQILESLD